MISPASPPSDGNQGEEAVGAPRLVAVSVDLDEVSEYLAIHGLPPSAGTAEHLVYEVALPRLQAWAHRESIPLTLFVIARDAQRAQAAEALRASVAAGAEIGNHSLDHRYDLTRLQGGDLRRQITRAQDILAAEVGERPVGFRAPGYTVTDRLLSLLEEEGFAYDASVFPCPAYYAAKLVVLAGMRLRGRASRSIVGHPRALAAPRCPYRAGRPFWVRGTGLAEVPVQVVGPLRLPFFGTTISLAPEPALGQLIAWAEREPSISLELHGLDFLDTADLSGPLPNLQPDLTVPFEKKLARLTRVVGSLRGAGFRFRTLRDLAAATVGTPANAGAAARFVPQ